MARPSDDTGPTAILRPLAGYAGVAEPADTAYRVHWRTAEGAGSHGGTAWASPLAAPSAYDVETRLKQLHDGFEYAERLGIPLKQLGEALRFNLRTLSRRKREGRLDTDESEKVFRVQRLLHLAEELFRDQDKARLWFLKPQRALGGQSPLAYADTEVGAREVENLIGRIRHGVFG